MPSSSSPDAAEPTWSTFPGLLLLSAATLLLEVALTRILSVTLWYHFAFMVISTALFGMGFAGVFLSLRKNAQHIPSGLLSGLALATPVCFVVGYALFQLVPFEPFSLGTDGIQWLYLPLSYLAVTLPFFGAGATIAALLTRHAASVHRLYLFDLVGAGLGSLAVVGFLPWLGGTPTVFVSGALAAVGAALIAREHGPKGALAAAALGCLLLVLAPWSDQLVPMRISSNKVVGGGPNARSVEDVLADPTFRRHTSWNTLSRIDVIEFRDGHGGLHRRILIDAGTAVTRMAHPEGAIDSLGPTQDEESFFFGLFDAPHVLVVGSGGGREVLLAIQNGARKVTAVEINPDINELVAEIMADFTGHLYQHPKVQVYTDEARSFIRRSGERYDVIHCPHTISNAAMSSGSLSLAENHLMTREAFEDYLESTTEGGVLVITRPEAHLPRLFATARAVMEQRGLSAQQGILAWRMPVKGLSFYAGFALKKSGFSAEVVENFSRKLKERRLEPLYLPGRHAQDPYGDILTPGLALEDVSLPFPAILEPATDDRPFFNQRFAFSEIGWSDLAGVFSQGQGGRMALEDRPVAEAALLTLLLEVVVLALFFIVLPLWIFRRRAIAGAHRIKTLVAFAALGLAYIVVEVGFIQRFTLYLGRPVVVFACVLGSMLVSSGLGSAFARRYTGQAAWRVCAVAASVALLTAFLASLVVDLTLSWPSGVRVLIAIVLLIPVGFVMGMPFPLLVRRLEAGFPERIPWAWGVNGFASVVGSITAIVLGMVAGYTLVLFLGVACYLLAALAAGKGWELS